MGKLVFTVYSTFASLSSWQGLAKLQVLQVVLTDLMVAFGGAGYSARLDIVDVAQH